MMLFKLFKNRNVLMLFLGQATSMIGDWFFRIALPLIVYNKTGSAEYVSLTVIVSTVPFFIFAPFGGVFADRFNRRKIMISADILRCLIFLIIALSPEYLMIRFIVVGSFFVAACDRFFGPSLSATLPYMVESEQLPALNSLFSMLATGIKLTVPPVAALLVSIIGVRSALLINSFSFIASSIGCLCVASEIFVNNNNNNKQGLTILGVIEDIKVGMRELFKQKMVMAVVLMWMIVWLGSAPYLMLLVVFVKETLHQGNMAFGWISSINAVGMLTGGWIAISLSKKVDIWHSFVWGLFLIAIGALIFAFSSDIYIASVGRFVAGLGSMIASVAEITIVQSMVPQYVRGRVIAFTDIALMGVSIVSMGFMTALLTYLSIRGLFYISAAAFTFAGMVALILGNKYCLVKNKELIHAAR